MRHDDDTKGIEAKKIKTSKTFDIVLQKLFLFLKNDDEKREVKQIKMSTTKMYFDIIYPSKRKVMLLSFG